MQPPVTRPADPSPVPARDDAPDDVKVWRRFDEHMNPVFHTRVPSPDVLREVLKRQRALLAAVTRDGEAGR
jgi:hypothetical protein